jgi:hypothetical protein
MASNQPSAGMNELLRLRGEVSRLRQSAQELAQLKAAATATGNDPVIEATLKSWATLATRLRERLEQMPDKKIPELQLLTQKDWFDAIKNAKQLDTDTDFREALHQLRNGAKQAFGDIAMEAIKSTPKRTAGPCPAIGRNSNRFSTHRWRCHARTLFTPPNRTPSRCAPERIFGCRESSSRRRPVRFNLRIPNPGNPLKQPEQSRGYRLG